MIQGPQNAAEGREFETELARMGLADIEEAVTDPLPPVGFEKNAFGAVEDLFDIVARVRDRCGECR